MQIYCLKCKEKKEVEAKGIIKETKNGPKKRAETICPDCGCKISTFMKLDK